MFRKMESKNRQIRLKNVFFGLIPFNKKKIFAIEEEALNWIKNGIFINSLNK